MSYIDADSDNILHDLLRRKEFYTLKNKRRYNADKSILPLFMVENELSKGNNLQFHSYQLFVQNLINVNTPYPRLLMKHSTGSGKTIGAIGIAMQFIKYYRQEGLIGTPRNEIGSIYIIAFDGAKRAFQKDLLRFPSFGFATRRELIQWEKLRNIAMSNNQADIDRAYDYGTKIKKRMGNRKGNGFFKFLGYKALVNRLFISEESLSNMSEDDIRSKLESGEVKYNQVFINSFKNSLIICDEIHNVYNSLQKNNWGVALQVILENDPSTRAIFMSATPINNSPSEIIDLTNLLLPRKLHIRKKEFFNKNTLLPDALNKLKKLCKGRVSYLMDKNPAFFPSRSFVGERIKGIKYLKFVRCEFTKNHAKCYLKALNEETNTLSQDSRYILDFILPNPDGSNNGIYKSSEVKRLALADQKWKSENNIDILGNNIPTGEILQLKTLRNVSSKYFAMMRDILKIIHNRQGKIMIYHNYVNMSGVLFIKEILMRNGIIDEYMGSTGNTLCSICGKARGNHPVFKDSIVVDKSKHEFKPVRFVIIHSELDKVTTGKSIDKFNRASNSMGDDFMIILGSRKIKESYDLKAIRNMMIVSRPDNIPTLIQIMGRAVRKNSHITLPKNMRQVFVSIYTSSLANGDMTYEEVMYKKKIKDYETIQTIERLFHENAVDSVINYDTVKPGLEKNNLGDLDFTPSLIKDKKKTEFTLTELNTKTFEAYYSQYEIDLSTYIIKRGFLETSTVWTWNDLLVFVKSPNFNVEYDTSMIHNNSIIIALSRLLWSQGTEMLNPYIEDGDININIIDKLFDPMDKRFIMPDGGMSVIAQVGKFYMLLPLNNNHVDRIIDAPYRNRLQGENINVNIIEYLETKSVIFNYNDRRSNFINKYEKIPIEQLGDAVCDYGTDFHHIFIEECIAYIFNSWTDWGTNKSDHHDFYFKILYYYDIMGLIIFADSVKGYIFKSYVDFILPNSVKSKKRTGNADNTLSMTENIDNTNLINMLTRNIAKSSCDRCPKNTKELYEKSLNKSLKRFTIIKKSKNIVKVHADVLPVGHFLGKVPKFYNPIKGWYASPEYISDKRQWVENSIIIGYDMKSKTGIHVRFKLRNPIQQIKVHRDARLIEKGSICATRSKTFLLSLCKKLNINTDVKLSVPELCIEIKSRLMYLELRERSRGTNIKFFYSHFEMSDSL